MLSAARQARVDDLENAAESLAVKNRELERTQAALRQTLEENTQLTQRVADLNAIVGSLRAREGSSTRSWMPPAPQSNKQGRHHDPERRQLQSPGVQAAGAECAEGVEGSAVPERRTTGAGAGSPECPGGRAQAGSVKCDAAGVVRFAMVAPSRDTAGVASFPSASSFGDAGWRQAALPAQPAAPGVD
jgi:hypothetical protein